MTVFTNKTLQADISMSLRNTSKHNTLGKQLIWWAMNDVNTCEKSNILNY